MLNQYTTNQCLSLLLSLCLGLFGGLSPKAAEVLTYDDVIAAATVVKLNMDENILPRTIPAGSTTITPAQFEYVACHVLIGLNGGTTSGTVTVVPAPRPPIPPVLPPVRSLPLTL